MGVAQLIFYHYRELNMTFKLMHSNNKQYHQPHKKTTSISPQKNTHKHLLQKKYKYLMFLMYYM